MAGKQALDDLIIKFDGFGFEPTIPVPIEQMGQNCVDWFGGEIGEIKQGLERLEQLEKIFSDSHICEIKARFNEIECTFQKCDSCPLCIGDGICLKNTFEKKWELQKENQKLKEENKKLKKFVGVIMKYLYYSNKSHCIKLKEIRKSTLNFDYEYLKELLEK